MHSIKDDPDVVAEVDESVILPHESDTAEEEPVKDADDTRGPRRS
jgi:hypothetical protein